MYEELIAELRHYFDGVPLVMQAADAIEELDNKLNLWRHDKISRWISVEERLPERCQESHYIDFSVDVIGFDGVTIFRAYYNYNAKVWLNGNCEMEWPQITHWMPLPPLPEPPKEET